MPDPTDHKPLITIDGPAGSGKSTVAALVASTLRYDCLNTGSIYRILTDDALHHGIEWVPEALIEHLTTCHVTIKHGVAVAINYRPVSMEDLKRPEINARIAVVSAQRSIREHVRTQTENYLDTAHIGAVCEGRDAGELFRWALPRIYLTARVDVRAARINGSVEEVQARDEADAQRTASPMMSSREAVLSGYTLIETDHRTPEQTALAIIQQHEMLMAPV